jgi:hypothetical protein
MRLYFGLAMLVCCALTGCHTPQQSIARENLVGTYVYRSEDPEARPTDHEWDRLTLEADGKYHLVQGGPTKARTETVGVWTFVAGIKPSISLDHAGYPVEIKEHQVRLLIDNDVGIWYAKLK